MRQIVVFLWLTVIGGYPGIEAAATGVRWFRGGYCRHSFVVEFQRDREGVHVRNAWGGFRTLEEGSCGGKGSAITTP